MGSPSEKSCRESCAFRFGGFRLLRFDEKDEEQEFKTHHADASCRWHKYFCSILIIVLSLGIRGIAKETQRKDVPFRWELQDVRTTYYGVHIFHLLLAFLFVCLICLRPRCRFLKECDWESLILVHGVATFASVHLLSWWYVATLFGVSPSMRPGDWGAAEHAVCLESIILFMAFTLEAPVRCCKLWLFPVVFWISYGSFRTFVGAPNTSAWILIVPEMVGVSVGFFYGALRQERHVREKWRAHRKIEALASDISCHTATTDAIKMFAGTDADLVMEVNSDYTIRNAGVIHTSFFGQHVNNKNFIDLISDGDEDRFTGLVDRAATSSCLESSPMKLQHGTGRTLDAHVQAAAVRVGDDRNFYIVSIRDITSTESSDAQDAENDEAEDLRRSDHIRAVTQRERDIEILSASAQSSAWQTAASFATDDMYADILREAGAHSNENPTRERVKEVLTELAMVGSAEHWLIDSKRLKIDSQRCLGEGGFGIVWQGELSGSDVAVKMPKTDDDESDSYLDSLPSFLNELRALRRVRHPNATLFHGALIVPHLGCLLLVSELVVGKNLQDLIIKSPPGPEAKWSIALAVCKVLRFMHSLSPVMVHGDLKGTNVMVEVPAMRAKLLDFGLARIKSRKPKNLKVGGSWLWAAPEIISHNFICRVREGRKKRLSVSPSADVFSFGRVLFLIFAGQRPYSNVKAASRDDILKYLEKSLEDDEALPDLEWPEDASARYPEVQSLVDACCKTVPADRLDLAEAQALIQGFMQRYFNAAESEVPSAVTL